MTDPTSTMEEGQTLSPPLERTLSSSSRPRYRNLLALFLVAGLVFAAIFTPIHRNNHQDNDDNGSRASSLDSSAASPTTGTTISSSTAYLAQEGPLGFNLTLFNPNVTQGYTNTRELTTDLESVARFLIGATVKRVSQYGGYQGQNAGGNVQPESSSGSGMAMADSSSRPGPVGDAATDYGTNNQEAGIEQGDYVVSDGTNVYAAYGDTIVIWNAVTGAEIAQIKMPPVNYTAPESPTNPGYAYSGMAVDSARSYMGGDMMPFPNWNPKANIVSMNFNNGRLMVVVQGYGVEHQMDLPVNRTSPILYNYNDLHVRLYDTTSLASSSALSLMGTKNITGSFVGLREINGIAHVITSAGLDTYTDLVAPFEATVGEDGVTDTVVALSMDQVNTFTTELMRELTVDGQVPNLAKISVWTTAVSANQTMEDVIFAGGIVNTLTQIFSFDMTGTANAGELAVSVSGSFMPSYWVEEYAMATTIVLAGQGYEYDEATGSSLQRTYLLAFGLNGAVTTPQATGTLEGYVTSSYAMDVKDNFLRIATTQQQNSWIPVFVEDASGNEVQEWVEAPLTLSANGVPSTTENYITVLEIPAAVSVDEPGQLITRGSVQLGKANETFHAIRFFDDVAYAITYERVDPLYALDLSDPDNLVVLGQIDDISGFSNYLHPMNDDATLLIGVGEDTDANGVSLGLMIRIFNATDPLQMTILHERRVLDDSSPYSSAYSDAQWDFLGFRYFSERLILPVDIYDWGPPTNADGSFNVTDYVAQEEFHGFFVFIASADVLEESCRISSDDGSPSSTTTTETVSPSDICFSCESYLPRRSMIFNGNVMTTHNHFIRSTDLDTCASVWSIDVLVQNSEEECCNPWLF